MDLSFTNSAASMYKIVVTTIDVLSNSYSECSMLAAVQNSYRSKSTLLVLRNRRVNVLHFRLFNGKTLHMRPTCGESICTLYPLVTGAVWRQLYCLHYKMNSVSFATEITCKPQNESVKWLGLSCSVNKGRKVGSSLVEADLILVRLGRVYQHQINCMQPISCRAIIEWNSPFTQSGRIKFWTGRQPTSAHPAVMWQIELCDQRDQHDCRNKC